MFTISNAQIIENLRGPSVCTSQIAAQSGIVHTIERHRVVRDGWKISVYASTW